MSAYSDDFRSQGYTTVLDPKNAELRERMTNANIKQSRDKSVIGVAVLPIIGKRNEDTTVLKKESVATEKPKRTRTRRVNISLSSYHRRLATAAVLSTTIALGGLGLSKKAVKQYTDMSVIRTYNRAFVEEVITPEKHPTQDHMGYYFDYSDIAQKVMSYDNIDTAVYLLIFDIGEYQADRVIACTPYKSLESFVKSRNYSDIDDFRNKAKDMLLLEDSIKKQQQDLDERRKEHADYIFEPSKQTNGEMDDMFTEKVPFDSEVEIYSGGVK